MSRSVTGLLRMFRQCRPAIFCLAGALFLFTAGCRTSYYTMMAAFGQEKRDLLKKSLNSAGEEQKEASEQFKDALLQLQELTGFEGGDLEKKYRAFKSDYDRCASQADTVSSRVRKVERVAGDLFAEWEKELEQIQNPTLRNASRGKLSETRSRYAQLHGSLVRAENSMSPVLSQMSDYVLFLKHNLNAQAIGSLKIETDEIEKEITRLIADMNLSIRETESFIDHLGQTGP